MVDRVDLVYRSGEGEDGKDVELPFRILVLGDFTRDERSAELGEQTPESLGADIDVLLARWQPTLTLRVADRLTDSDYPLDVQIPIRRLQDFGPDHLLDAVPVLSSLYRLRRLCAEAREETFKPVQWAVDAKALIDGANALLEGESARQLASALGLDSASRPDGDVLAMAIAELDARLARQLDEILHHPELQRLEAAWRALAFLAERMDFAENLQLDLLNVSREALQEDLEDAPEVVRSTLYQRVYSDEFGQFGGRPYSVLIGDYRFGPAAPDVWLLQQVAAVAAMSHAPFIAGLAPAMFQLDDFSGLARLRDLDALFGQPQFAKWRSLRQSEDARYVGLTLPGFRLREPYRSGDERVTGIDYTETLRGESDGLWGNSAFAFATRLADSFATTRWCLAIHGAEGGRVEGLHLATQGGAARARIPTEVLISERREAQLIEQGFIPLSVHKGADTAAFYASGSIQAVTGATDGASPAARLGRTLGAQLSYLFIVSRLAHYIKVMQREHLGSWRQRSEIEREVNEWLKQYVSDMDNPAPGVRARRPLRRANLEVEEVEGKGDWYRIDLHVTPHLKYMGSAFTLAEVGKLDKS